VYAQTRISPFAGGRARRPLGVVSARDALDDDLYELRVELETRGDERD
jgi:hypothetical protein